MRSWLLLLSLALGSAACHSDPKAPPAIGVAADGRIAIAVTADGFVPNKIRVKVGQPVTLVVTRQVERTCAKQIVIKDFGIDVPLPQGQPVEVTITPTKAGPIHYACGMDMISGDLVAE
jgi:plastocyanin domain-containing protein